jgi:hypothetical protein
MSFILIGGAMFDDGIAVTVYADERSWRPWMLDGAIDDVRRGKVPFYEGQSDVRVLSMIERFGGLT